MAEDRTSDPADEPENDKPEPRDKPSEPYRLGGSGGSAKGPQGPSGKSGGEPDNPFEAFFSSLAGGDMGALAAQLQSAFAMLGGSGSMFTSGPTESGSGVNWEVTKNTARKTVASLGPDPSPDAGQQRAIADAVELAEVWLYQATAFPR
ncbi:MAG TPA: zinc-dependent metalloprotease, partial [Propionibacteriaceae bacterium]|nr:zinc-dependent metalloprotease [Propionibacteriaceae bacterium]